MTSTATCTTYSLLMKGRERKGQDNGQTEKFDGGGIG